MSRSWKKRKFISISCILLIILLIGMFFIATPVNAYIDKTQEEETEDDSEEETEETDDDSGYSISSEGIMDMIDNVFMGSGTYISYSSTQIPSRLYTIFKGSEKGILSTVYEFVTGFSLVFLCLIYIVRALQAAGRGTFTLESQFKFFLMLFINIIIIAYIDDIMNFVFNIGCDVIYNLRELAMDSIGSGSVGSLESSPWMVKVISRLAFWVAKFSFIIPCWTIFYELVIRYMFAPIAIVDVVAEGWRSPGVKFLKGYLGVFIKIGAAYLIAALLCVCLSTLSSEDGALIKFMSTIGIIFGGSKLIGKSQSIINEALGV